MSWKERGQLRSPGFRGGKGVFLNDLIAVPYASVPATMPGPELYRLERTIDPAPPGSPFAVWGYSVPIEARVFFAFDVDGSGNAVPQNCEFDEIWWSCQSMIYMDYTTAVPGSWPTETIWIPFWAMVYPITTPWAVPIHAGAGVYNPNNLWANQPTTVFTANGGAPAPAGSFVNPATGLVDNYMALFQCGNLQVSIESAFITTVGPVQNECSSDLPYCGFQGGRQLTPMTPSIADPFYQDPYTLIRRSPIQNVPSGQIYGFGLYVFSLWDFYQQMIAGATPAFNLYGIAPQDAPFLVSLNTPVGGGFYTTSLSRVYWECYACSYGAVAPFDTDNYDLTNAADQQRAYAGVTPGNIRALKLAR